MGVSLGGGVVPHTVGALRVGPHTLVVFYGGAPPDAPHTLCHRLYATAVRPIQSFYYFIQ